MSTLIGKIIIATQLDFSNFKEAILLIVEDDNKGSMGIVLNKLSNYSTDEFFESLKLKNNLKYTDKPINIYEGGPIQQESGFRSS